MKFRKKPVVINAIQLTPRSFKRCLKFVGDKSIAGRIDEYKCFIGLKTLEGDFGAMHGDWIIKGINGEFYPCKPDIFEKTYEMV